MSRPKSMPDFSALLDASTPLPEHERPRKKPSISLAAGLIMASESPRSTPNTPQLRALGRNGDGWSDNLFYAYAQKSDYAHSPPYILTFASAAICEQWWALVRREYPESTRVGPQLFILKGDDMQEQIQDNPKFYDLRNKWFYTPSDGSSSGVIPLQDYRGHPITAPPALAPTEEKGTFDMATLSETLDKMNAMITENTNQIRALSVAQSEGLQRMQDINESNSTQINALADGQAKLQSIIDQNASHYIALSNSSFTNQEQVKTVLQSNAEQIQNLAGGQTQLAKTCEGMMRAIESLSNTVGRVNDTMSHMSLAGSETASNPPSNGPPFGAIANRISPPPRKLNRRIKGVWYEYDANTTPASSPRKSVTMPDTPPKSPLSSKIAR
ncbi:hypothetical protein BU26DRAFT_454925 [Trematosphaeria pertusa]|uniref:Uncharacterized protein n=1 Tax=Trematosphaeria pertusa TaxID=390896 RepID=A0A6A6IGV6_9PLEO|nr:uncharacterized protein BU26DRAFT_454925 [Trematosphaeria pertusa]KAF2249651.1 hypothetical protein BU26DRAFT_454925 [Trematosphaeria pertusa]